MRVKGELVGVDCCIVAKKNLKQRRNSGTEGLGKEERVLDCAFFPLSFGPLVLGSFFLKKITQ